MYASVAGLRAHMQKLSVIGNNVANVNTQGYKKQRTIFRDSMYSMYSSGGNGTSTVGGINPSQIGYGSMIGSIDLNMSSASYNPGNPTDCALVGDGFFLVGDKTVANSIDGSNPASLKSLTLTRVGDFQFKADGYLCDGKGNPVYGFMTIGVDDNGDPIVSDQLVPIRKPHWERVPAMIKGEDDDGNEVETPGFKYVIRYATEYEPGENGLAKDPLAPGEDAKKTMLWDVNKPQDPSNRIDKETGTATTDESKMADLDFAEFSNITINQDTGAIVGICREGDQQIIMGYLAIGSVTNPNGVTHTGGPYYKCMPGAGNLRVSSLGIDLPNGYLGNKKSPDGEGGIPGADTEAASANDKIWNEKSTQLQSQGLEASGTDLAYEFAEMVTTQRGYQANTRIVTVTDSMLEELVNMKR